MRSFFKKPEWAAKPGDTGSEFYRRSRQTYGDIVAANREAIKKSKITSDKLENSEETGVGEDVRHSKRPRLSSETENAESDAADTSQHAQETKTEEHHKPQSSSEGLENTEADTADTSQHTRKAEAEEHHKPQTSSKDSQTQREGATSEPKDEISSVNPNLSLGRPKDGLSILTSDNSMSPRPLPRLPSENVGSESSDATHEVIPRQLRAGSTPQPTQPSAPPKDDPVVQILITSQIPNTKPLLVHRKMSQGLREVRLEWCKRQGITKETQSSVYLTWRGRRLFDVTTCRSLGIKLESKLALPDLDDDPIAGPKELRIHMEAVTDDQHLLNRPGLSPDEDKASPAPPSAGDDHNESMKLILRSPGMNDFRIKARPTTLVSRLISAFRDKQNIPADKDVLLLFDGDRLDPESCLRDHDIDDLDMVEVQIKSRV